LQVRKRVKALVQPADLMPTLLELAGIESPDFIQGSSVLSLIKGRRRKVRGIAVTGSTSVGRRAVELTVTSERWSLIHPVRRGGWELYDLKNDPRQKKNVIAKHAAVAEDLHEKLLGWLAEHDAPEWLRGAYEKCEEVKDDESRIRSGYERHLGRKVGVPSWRVSFSDD